jgi:hypothetical protein
VLNARHEDHLVQEVMSRSARSTGVSDKCALVDHAELLVVDRIEVDAGLVTCSDRLVSPLFLLASS